MNQAQIENLELIAEFEAAGIKNGTKVRIIADESMHMLPIGSIATFAGYETWRANSKYLVGTFSSEHSDNNRAITIKEVEVITE